MPVAPSCVMTCCSSSVDCGVPTCWRCAAFIGTALVNAELPLANECVAIVAKCADDVIGHVMPPLTRVASGLICERNGFPCMFVPCEEQIRAGMNQ